MPRLPLHPSSGIGVVNAFYPRSIRFVRYGCANRPFYHIVVMPVSVHKWFLIKTTTTLLFNKKKHYFMSVYSPI